MTEEHDSAKQDIWTEPFNKAIAAAAAPAAEKKELCEKWTTERKNIAFYVVKWVDVFFLLWHFFPSLATTQEYGWT